MSYNVFGRMLNLAQSVNQCGINAHLYWN